MSEASRRRWFPARLLLPQDPRKPLWYSLLQVGAVLLPIPAAVLAVFLRARWRYHAAQRAGGARGAAPLHGSAASGLGVEAWGAQGGGAASSFAEGFTQGRSSASSAEGAVAMVTPAMSAPPIGASSEPRRVASRVEDALR